jgi:hypothetical protein
MQRKSVKPEPAPQIISRPGCSIAGISHHGMAGDSCVPSNLVLAAGEKRYFNKRIT